MIIKNISTLKIVENCITNCIYLAEIENFQINLNITEVKEILEKLRTIISDVEFEIDWGVQEKNLTLNQKEIDTIKACVDFNLSYMNDEQLFGYLETNRASLKSIREQLD